MLKQDNTPYITFEDSEVGQTWTIKAVSITAYNLTANFSTSPTDSVTIS
jgi:hypothetical protein